MGNQSKKPQNNFFKPLGVFLRRSHLLIFFVFTAGCVAAAVVLINGALTNPADDTYTSPINAGSIDQTTLERVQSLHTSSAPVPAPQLPAGRTNPFAE